MLRYLAVLALANAINTASRSAPLRVRGGADAPLRVRGGADDARATHACAAALAAAKSKAAPPPPPKPKAPPRPARIDRAK